MVFYDLPPGLFAPKDFLPGYYPGFCGQEGLIKTLQHLAEHTIWHGKAEFIGLKVFSCRNIPSPQNGLAFPIGQVFAGPSDQARAGSSPR